MKIFLKKIIIFTLPIFLMLLFSLIILKTSGEQFTDIDSVIENHNDYLIGFTNDENRYSYLKWSTINKKERFTVLALGSSRVLQFRQEMFNERFYNAGYTVENISDFKNFLKSFSDDKLPKYLIIGIDQWMFNENWNGFNLSNKPKEYWANNSFSFDLTRVIDFYKKFFNGIFNVNDYDLSKYKVGFNAKFNNIGFRKDGSMNYGKQIIKLINKDNSANDYLFKDTYFRINNNSDRFEYGENISLLSLNKLREFLDYCTKKNIEVIGFLPPFAEVVYDKMVKSEKYKYIDKISPTITKLFFSYNFEFYDYTSMKKHKTNDNEYIDGFHGSEVIYYRILLDMLKNKSILNNISAYDKIKAKLNNRKNDLQIDE